MTTLRGLLQQDSAQSIFRVSPLLSALQEEGIKVDPLQNVANPGILVAIEIQTKGAQLNYVVWTVTQSFPPKGAQPVIGGAPWPGNLNRNFTAFRLVCTVMQQCLLTMKHDVLTRNSASCIFAPLQYRRICTLLKFCILKERCLLSQ